MHKYHVAVIERDLNQLSSAAHVELANIQFIAISDEHVSAPPFFADLKV